MVGFVLLCCGMWLYKEADGWELVLDWLYSTVSYVVRALCKCKTIVSREYIMVLDWLYLTVSYVIRVMQVQNHNF
jgi:hypothetical protein